MKSENFYILLDLSYDPPEYDENVIRKAINKKRLEWSAMRNHPTKKLEAKFYLEMIPTIEEVMIHDKRKRKKEAIEAKKIRNLYNKQKYEELNKAIYMLSVKGYIAEEELQTLKNKFKFINEEEILERINFKVRRSDKRQRILDDLDSITYKNISDNLKILGEKSLYTFLGVSKTSSIEYLNKISKRLYEEIRKNSLKNAIISAKGELQGLCDVVFKNETTRKKYDNSLKKEGLKKIKSYIDISGSKKLITVEEFDEFTRRIIEEGFEKKQAENYIIDYCNKNHWAIEVPRKYSFEKGKKCGFCGIINNSSSKYCAFCGYLLDVKCPNCGKVFPSNVKVCDKCGYFIGNEINKSAKNEKCNYNSMHEYNKYPLELPRTLKYNVSEDSVLLKWDQNKIDESFYKIIRTEGYRPNGINDGEEIASTTNNMCIDRNVEAGYKYYYSLFVVKGTQVSEKNLTVGPIMIIKEVSNLKLVPGDNKINISWVISKKALRIEVYRKKENIPLFIGDGEKVDNVRIDGVDDIDVKNNSNYGYLISTVFKDISGKEIYTKGLTCYSKPMKIPDPIENLYFIRKDNGIEVTYAPQIEGKVDLIYSKSPFKYNSGEIISRKYLNEIGYKLPFKSNGKCFLSLKSIGRFFILPIISKGNISVIGAQKEGEYIEDISNLRVYTINNKIHLNWDSPQSINKFYVAYKKYESINGINDSEAKYREITLREYRNQSACIIGNISEGEYYFKVFSMVEDKYYKKYSEGVECKVKYDIERYSNSKGGFFKNCMSRLFS